MREGSNFHALAGCSKKQRLPKWAAFARFTNQTLSIMQDNRGSQSLAPGTTHETAGIHSVYLSGLEHYPVQR